MKTRFATRGAVPFIKTAKSTKCRQIVKVQKQGAGAVIRANLTRNRASEPAWRDALLA
jgi:hypothetical protein